MTAVTGARSPSGFAAYGDAEWTSGVQWKAVVSGALSGFGVTLILSTLGAAIGFTAGNAVGGAEGGAVGMGALVWWGVTVLIAGVVAGRVLAWSARGASYSPAIYGMLAWALGVIILLFLLASGIGSVIGGLGGGLGAAVAQRGRPNMSPTDSMQVAHAAAQIGQKAAWGLLISQLVGLGATILAAGRQSVPRETAIRERVQATS